MVRRMGRSAPRSRSPLHPLGPQWHARQVVRELNDRPHLLAEIEIANGSFPQLGSYPWIRVTAGRRVAVSWFAEISDDGTILRGYFAVDALPPSGVIDYGYAGGVFGQLSQRFDLRGIKHLQPRRLPKETVRITTKFLEHLQHPA